MKPSPEEIEKIIHAALHALPERRAPRSLESRVLAAIEHRASLPWWRKSFLQWPIAAKAAFIVLSAGLVKLALMATVWAVGGFQSSELVHAFIHQFAWVDAIRGAIRGTAESFTIVFRTIPSLWLYGVLACVGAVYATLFSIGATAYRAFKPIR